MILKTYGISKIDLNDSIQESFSLRGILKNCELTLFHSFYEVNNNFFNK